MIPCYLNFVTVNPIGLFISLLHFTLYQVMPIFWNLDGKLLNRFAFIPVESHSYFDKCIFQYFPPCLFIHSPSLKLGKEGTPVFHGLLRVVISSQMIQLSEQKM